MGWHFAEYNRRGGEENRREEKRERGKTEIYTIKIDMIIISNVTVRNRSNDTL